MKLLLTLNITFSISNTNHYYYH